MSDIITLSPIGFVRSPFNERYLAPIQAEPENEERSTIELNGGSNYETALRDLQVFDRIWVIWLFHEARSWKPIIQTPRDGSKHGVFATRSPHRPNPLALSVVRLHGIQGRVLTISGADMVDGTPVLDLKPYIPRYDSFPLSRAGWVDTLPEPLVHTINWSEFASTKSSWIDEHTTYKLTELIVRRLSLNPFPTSSNRIERLTEHEFCLSSRAWRVFYTMIDSEIVVQDIRSAYTLEMQEQLRLELNSIEAQAHMDFLNFFSA